MTLFNLSQDREKVLWRTRYRYAVYEHKLLLNQKEVYTKSFIVVKNQYNVIVHFTKFHNYIDLYETGITRPITSDVKVKMSYVCSMLNYIMIDNYSQYKVNHVFDITKEMLEDYFQYYALTPKENGEYRTNAVVNLCVCSVVSFMKKLCKDFDGYMKLSLDDLYTEKNVFTDKGKIENRIVPNFKVSTNGRKKQIFRDIPQKVFEVILSQAYIHMPEIAFAICLQGFAGLRPGEVCNVRQETSPIGRGIIVKMSDNKMKSVEIDLTVEYLLRSDGIYCGKIKKERKQCVYPAFLEAFEKAYEFHKKQLSGKAEKEYMPMFIGRSGKAMTYSSYLEKFHKLINEYVRPILLKSDDVDCRLYGQLLYEKTLSPHALRHFYSVQLVLMGEDVAGIQYWRGDSNPESALAYLQNKGDLIRELSEVNNKFADLITNKGGILYEHKENQHF